MTALNFGKSSNFHSSKLVSETTTLITFYNTNNVEKCKYVTYFNIHNKVTLELRYDQNDSLKQRLTRLYDSTGTRSIGRRFENWSPTIGHTSESNSYEYDSNGFLTKVIDKDQNGKILRQTTIINNDKGYPIDLTVSNGKEIQGKETAEYNYEKNEATIKFFNKKGENINTTASKIEFTNAQPENSINDHGDLTKTVTYETEFKYDKFGNWKKKVSSRISNGILSKRSEETRTIKYL
jgi:hypothetical protein